MSESIDAVKKTPIIMLIGSYPESGLSGLSPVGIVSGCGGTGSLVGEGDIRAQGQALVMMRRDAEEKGCTHVFNVRFAYFGEDDDGQSIANGDGYKASNQKGKDGPVNFDLVSRRLRHVLISMGVKTLAGMAALTRCDLAHVSNCGPATFREMHNYLVLHGWKPGFTLEG